METGAFAPLYTKSNPPAQGGLLASVSVTASVAAAASTAFLGNPQSRQVQIANTTNQWAYVNFGNLVVGAVTAATVAASYPVAPGAVIVVSLDIDVNSASVILGGAPTGSALVTFTRGEGI